MKYWTLVCLVVAAAPGTVRAQAAGDLADEAAARRGAAAVEPVAWQVLGRACDYLQALDHFAFRSEASHDEVLAAGYRLQYSRDTRIMVQRPDRLRVDTESDKGARTVWYDGATLTILDRDLNLYARFEAPATIDATLDALADRGIEMPLDDLLHSDPCAFRDELIDGYYVGLNFVGGANHHHLLLANDAVDVQLWVEDDDTPLIRKVVITYGEEPGEPQFSALLSEWEVALETGSNAFAFDPPDGAREIAFRPRHSE